MNFDGLIYRFCDRKEVEEAAPNNMDYFERAREGDVVAMVRLGKLYYEGKGVEKNIDESIRWMRAAAEKNSAWAKNELIGILIQRCNDGDLEEAHNLCLDLVAKEDTAGMVRLGKLYYEGKGVEKNIDESIRWMRAAAEKNSAWAKNELIGILIQRCNDGDLEEARKLLSMLAEAGDIEAAKKMVEISHIDVHVDDDPEIPSNFVIYHLNHYSSLSYIILLRFVTHRDKRAYLIVHERSGKEKLLFNLLNNKIFDRIIIFNERRWYNIQSREEILQDLNSYFNGLLEKFEVNIHNADEIYTSADLTNSFGIYLIANRIDFTLFDLEKNQFSLERRYEIPFRDGWISEAYYSLQKEFGVLCGEKNNCKLLCKLESTYSPAILRGKRYGVYDFNNLTKLNKIDRAKILNCFNMDLDVLSGNVQLMIMNSRDCCGGNSIYSWERSPYLFQILRDFFSIPDMKMVIKQHPHDTINFSKFFPNAVILDTDLQIEFIKLYDNLHIKYSLYIDTTAGERLKGFIESELSVGWIFYKIAPYLSKLYACYSLSLNLGDFSHYQQLLTEKRFNKIEESLMKKFMEMNFEMLDSEMIKIEEDVYSKNSFIILRGDQKINYKKICNDSVVIFISPGANISKTENIVSMKYHIQKIDEHSLAEDCEEEIFVYSKNQKMLEKVKKFNLSKKLEHSGSLITLQVND